MGGAGTKAFLGRLGHHPHCPGQRVARVSWSFCSPCPTPGCPAAPVHGSPDLQLCERWFRPSLGSLHRPRLQAPYPHSAIPEPCSHTRAAGGGRVRVQVQEQILGPDISCLGDSSELSSLCRYEAGISHPVTDFTIQNFTL